MTINRRLEHMNKKEIEEAIFAEMSECMQKIGVTPWDKALPILQNEAWRIADKYDTDGGNVINILLTYMNKEKR
jgi:hypothetical protein